MAVIDNSGPTLDWSTINQNPPTWVGLTPWDQLVAEIDREITGGVVPGQAPVPNWTGLQPDARLVATVNRQLTSTGSPAQEEIGTIWDGGATTWDAGATLWDI